MHHIQRQSGNVKLAMSHVVPDLVQKVLKGQDPLHILGSGDRVPDTEKATKILGFEATTTLAETLDQVIPWIDQAIKNGMI